MEFLATAIVVVLAVIIVVFWKRRSGSGGSGSVETGLPDNLPVYKTITSDIRQSDMSYNPMFGAQTRNILYTYVILDENLNGRKVYDFYKRVVQERGHRVNEFMPFDGQSGLFNYVVGNFAPGGDGYNIGVSVRINEMGSLEVSVSRNYYEQKNN